MRRLALMFGVFVVCAGLVAGSALGLAIDQRPPPPGQVGAAYSFRFNMQPGSGSPGMTWRISSGALPPGLSLSFDGSLWADVTGTPTQAGAWTFYLQAVDLPGPWVCCSEQLFTITVTTRMIVATNSLPDANINQAYNTQLGVSGGTVSSWALIEGALPDGLALDATSGVISGTPTKAGPFGFRVKATGSPNSDDKSLSIFVAAPLELGGPTGQTYPTQPVPIGGKVNTPFSWGVKASGGREPYVYTSTTLPAGLTLNPDGVLSGTPTVAGLTQVTFTVTDANQQTDTLKAAINTKALLAFGITKPPTGKVGKAFHWQLPVTGASKLKRFEASGKFPPGLDLDETTGTLNGTPLKAGRYKIKIWVLGDPGTQISKTYTLTIRT